MQLNFLGMYAKKLDIFYRNITVVNSNIVLLLTSKFTFVKVSLSPFVNELLLKY